MKIASWWLGVLTAVISTNAAHSEEINVFKLLSERTAPYLTKRVSELCKTPFYSCFGVRFRNVHLIPIKVDYSDVHPDPLPVEVLQQTFFFRNCTSGERNDNRSTSFKYTDGYTITTKDTVSNTMGESVGFNIYGVKIGITAQEKVDFSNQNTINRQKEEKDDVILIEKIEPYTDLNVIIQKKIGRAYLDFSGTVDISADVVMDMSGGAHGWDYPLGRLSDILPDRQFVVTGQIWNGQAENYQKIYKETKYTEATCPSGNPPPATLFAPLQEK